MNITRIAGQSASLPGAVRAGDIIVTSGVVHPDLLQGGPAPDFRAQAETALRQIIDYTRHSGGDMESILKIDAYLANADDMPVWNEIFSATWPVPGPARTTLIVGFAIPGIQIEIQALAVAR